MTSEWRTDGWHVSKLERLRSTGDILSYGKITLPAQTVICKNRQHCEEMWLCTCWDVEDDDDWWYIERAVTGQFQWWRRTSCNQPHNWLQQNLITQWYVIVLRVGSTGRCRRRPLTALPNHRAWKHIGHSRRPDWPETSDGPYGSHHIVLCTFVFFSLHLNKKRIRNYIIYCF